MFQYSTVYSVLHVFDFTATSYTSVRFYLPSAFTFFVLVSPPLTKNKNLLAFNFRIITTQSNGSVALMYDTNLKINKFPNLRFSGLWTWSSQQRQLCCLCRWWARTTFNTAAEACSFSQK